MVLVWKWPFFELFFLSKTGQENVFYDILERIKAFLGYENKKLKRRKIDIFPKGLTHGFGLKMAIFRTFFWGAKNARKKSLLRYSRTNKGLSKIWKQKVETVKKLTFFQRGSPMVLVSKWPFFKPFFFRENRLEISLFDEILERIKAFLRYENKKLKQSKNWHLFKGVNPFSWYQNGHYSNFFF